MRLRLIISCGALVLSGCSMFLSYNICDEELKESVEWRGGTVDFASAIRAGAVSNGWTVTAETPGMISLRLQIRANVVDVDVYYGRTEFLVKYKASENMDYDPTTGSIHGKYVTWVRHLKQAIKNSAKRM